jgi:hypothetical protein
MKYPEWKQYDVLIERTVCSGASYSRYEHEYDRVRELEHDAETRRLWFTDGDGKGVTIVYGMQDFVLITEQ